MKIGVIKTSLKENERRIPIYPDHLQRIPESLRGLMSFEKGYGLDVGLSDEYFFSHGAQTASREELFSSSDLIILPKPMPQDLAQMKPHQILFGWAHCVQQKDITQLAIDHRLTIIAWESMHAWSDAGKNLCTYSTKTTSWPAMLRSSIVFNCLELMAFTGHEEKW